MANIIETAELSVPNGRGYGIAFLSSNIYLILDAAQHTKIETIFPVFNGYLMWIINQENKLTNIYYKLFYIANIRKTKDFF